MEVFLEKMQQLLPVLGVEVLVPTHSVSKSTSEKQLLTCKIKNNEAKGYLTPNGIVVLSGSQAVLKERPSTKKYPHPSQVRQKLKDDGMLTKKEDHLLFTQDVEFSSPSAAASVIHGGHANGLTAWKNRAGKSLKALESTKE